MRGPGHGMGARDVFAASAEVWDLKGNSMVGEDVAHTCEVLCDLGDGLTLLCLNFLFC